jgi:hypothetical protein
MEFRGHPNANCIRIPEPHMGSAETLQ